LSLKTEFEIFLGTGGVGKTTLSYSRASALATAGHKVLILTIDPSKRLEDFINVNKAKNLEVEIFNPEESFEKLLEGKQLRPTRISRIIMSKWGGMTEILSLITLSKLLESENYDYVILDTAPGEHFIDFLENKNRVVNFFSEGVSKVISLFNQKKSKNIFQRTLGQGVSKLLNILNDVTGETFVSEFIETLSLIHEFNEEFKSAVQTQKNYLSSSLSKWYLVSNAEQRKYEETISTFSQALKQESVECIGVLNKVLPQTSPVDKDLATREKELIEHLVSNQIDLEKKLLTKFPKIIKFHQIYSDQIEIHVESLSQQWINYDLQNKH